MGMRGVCVALAVAVGGGCAARQVEPRSADARRHEPTDREVAPGGGVTRDLARALDARLTVWTRPDGTHVHVRHCRRAPTGCRTRIRRFAGMLVDVARRHRLDPFLLAAIAVHESALNPEAIGASGEAGIIQLHPRGAGRGVRFVEEPGYRASCVARVDACQRPVLERGARYLVRGIERCGTATAAVGFYNAGRCDPDRRYVQRVLHEARRLRASVDP